MNSTELAKKAAIEQIREKQKYCYKYAAGGYYIKTIYDNVEFIKNKSNEYDLGDVYISEANSRIYECFMKNEHFEMAETFAKKTNLNNTNNTSNKKTFVKNTIDGDKLSLSIGITVFFGFIYLMILMLGFDLNFLIALIISIVLAFIHPYIGKIFYSIVIGITEEYDSVFSSQATISTKDNSTLFMAGWPLVGIPMIIYYSLGVVFGKIFKNI